MITGTINQSKKKKKTTQQPFYEASLQYLAPATFKVSKMPWIILSN